MKEKTIDVIMLTCAALFQAIAVRMFFTEFELTPGGITGLAITLSAVTGISVDVISLGISIPLLVIGTLCLGKSFGIKTLYITLMTPFFLHFIPQTHVTGSILLACILGGVLVGVSIGIAISRKCATGGTDIIAMLLHIIIKKVDVATLIFICDMLIVLSSWMISKNALTSVYSAVSLFIIMETIKLFGRINNRQTKTAEA